jgi:hypothetical protein
VKERNANIPCALASPPRNTAVKLAKRWKKDPTSIAAATTLPAKAKSANLRSVSGKARPKRKWDDLQAWKMAGISNRSRLVVRPRRPLRLCSQFEKAVVTFLAPVRPESNDLQYSVYNPASVRSPDDIAPTVRTNVRFIN